MNRVSFGLPSFGFPVFSPSLFSGGAKRKKLRLNHFIVGILFSFGFFVFLPLPAGATMIFSVDYLDGTFGNVAVRKAEPGAGYPSLAYQPSKGHSAQIVNAPGRSGSKAVKMTLLPTDKGYQYGQWQDPYVRAEFEKQGFDHMGREFWYGFSINVDPVYQDGATGGAGAVMVQWHTNKDSCDSFASPELAIHIREGVWRIVNNFDANACSTSSTYSRQSWDVGAVQKGVWVDWVVSVKWSYGSDGFLKVWKDGKLIVDKKGPNVFNNAAKQKFKWGVYNGRWGTQSHPASDKLVAYFLEVNIGNANSSYAAVAPQNSQPATLAAPMNLRLIKD